MGTWPLHTRPSVVIQTLCPSVPVNATTDGDWPVVLEAIVPFHTPGVVAAVGGVGPGPDPVGGDDGVVLELPPPHAVTVRATTVSARTVTRRFIVLFIRLSRFGFEFGLR
jgi:hypothetical protein